MYASLASLSPSWILRSRVSFWLALKTGSLEVLIPHISTLLNAITRILLLICSIIRIDLPAPGYSPPEKIS